MDQNWEIAGWGDVPPSKIRMDQNHWVMYPPPPHTKHSGLMVTMDLTTIQVDLIQMDDYPDDSCAISPTAFLLTAVNLDSSGVSEWGPLLCAE